MLSPYILRFQETNHGSDGPQLGAGTQTGTAVKAEPADSDFDRGYGAFESVTAGTQTGTRIRAEHADQDRSLSSTSLIPKAGTQTATFVRSEHGDTDRHEQRHRAFVQCSSS